MAITELILEANLRSQSHRRMYACMTITAHIRFNLSRLAKNIRMAA
jgi:hypothetical protein